MAKLTKFAILVCMGRRIHIWRFFAIVFAVITAISAYLSVEFESFLNEAEDDEFVYVIAVFDEPPGYRDSISGFRQSPNRRDEIIAYLQRESDILCGMFIDEYFGHIKGGDIRSIRRIWLVPSIAMEVRAGLLRGIVQSGYFSYFVHNRPYQMLVNFDEVVERCLWDTRWHVSHIGAEAVYDEGYFGSGVVIAVFDTGVRYTHSDLADRMWVNEGEISGNGIDNDGNGYIDDYHGFEHHWLLVIH